MSAAAIERNIHEVPKVDTTGTIIGIHGEKLTPTTSLMGKIDEQVTTPITISRGLATIAGVLIALLSGIAGIWIYSVTSAMSYQTVVNRVGVVEARLDKIDTVITDLQGLKMTTNNLQNDVKAIRDKQVNDEPDRKELIKNIGDIRILLAQKGMQ